MVNYQKVWADIAVNLMDRLNPDDLNTVQQAVICALGKYDISEKPENTELVAYNDDMTGYTMFFCSKGVEGLSKRTLKFYKETIDKMLYFVRKPLNAITTDDIRYYLACRHTKDGISVVSMENERRNLNSFFGWLCEESYIPKNICRPIKKIKAPKIKKKAFTDVEIQKIKDACMHKYRTCCEEKQKRNIALIEFFISTGCRVAEVSSLKREKIDLEHNCATVIGKGNKERVVYLTQVAKM